ncbi:hypothetical protein [Bacillus sp. EAC]|uniref:hypothetical protein n=1 Tax=Bacillus sp. EAC TaxID=1978338 RepID=UPI000B4360CA|nr:hypothetical protein [Bacillus sp. EAC]
MITIYVIIGILVIMGLIFIDIKRNYNEIPIFKWTFENGDFYFSVPYYIWQVNKKMLARKMYFQNSILDFEGYKYEITNFGGDFPRTKGGLFFERELRFWGNPLNILRTNSNMHITINQYGSGNINIELNNNEYINNIMNIQEYLSKDIYINGTDKELMQNFLNKILSGQSINIKEAKGAYDTFLKYEPLLSFAVDILSLIKEFFSGASS